MGETTKSNCRNCARQTNHDVLFETSHEASEPYFHELHTWQVLKCRGCDTIGFRYRFDDYDDVTELPSGRAKHAVTYGRYPAAVPGHRQLDHQFSVPPLIRNIYRQSLGMV
jgi:hypothetical protein